MLLYSPFTLLVQYYFDSAFYFIFDDFKRVVFCLEGRFSRRWRFMSVTHRCWFSLFSS
jgi:hypothetical protein